MDADARAGSGAVHALALVAALRTARAVAGAVADRRAGRDASAQEPPAVAARDLADLRGALAAHAVQLRLWAASPAPTDPTARLVHAFEARLVADDAARALGTAHQKLLSLYPSVEPDAVEATRVLAADAARAVAADHPDLGALGARLADVLDGWETA